MYVYYYHSIVYRHCILVYFFFFLAFELVETTSFLRFWFALGCGGGAGVLELLLLPGVLGVFFFFSARSFSSSSRFSRSISVISVLQRRCSSNAVRDLMNQSNRNCGDALQPENIISIRINPKVE